MRNSGENLLKGNLPNLHTATFALIQRLFGTSAPSVGVNSVVNSYIVLLDCEHSEIEAFRRISVPPCSRTVRTG